MSGAAAMDDAGTVDGAPTTVDGARVVRGSYAPGDVTFLLKPVALAPTAVALKERMIQSGRAHYSEMISTERRPDGRYLALYGAALDRSAARIAREIEALAERLVRWVEAGTLAPGVTLCSLVRAGVPYGVLLLRALRARGLDAAHYGVSIIRDRGLDPNAMAVVLRRRPPGGIVFVDGWTGKGAIAGELDRSWRTMTGRAPRLVVLADPGGHADAAGSHEDWLIPSGLLGGNVSGLVSRSILRDDLIGPGDFHGAVSVDHLADIDLSRPFVERVRALAPRVPPPPAPAPSAREREALRRRATGAVRAVANRYGVDDVNRIKPGIAEATRAVLRRRPERVLVSDPDDPDVAALCHLCGTDGVELRVAPDLLGPYRAITLIGRTS